MGPTLGDDAQTAGGHRSIARHPASPGGCGGVGRLGVYEEIYQRLLGDPSKLVQRTAAWAMRQSFSRNPAARSSDLLAALESPDDRTRWGATRVFAAHFSALGRRPELAASLAKLADDP